MSAKSQKAALKEVKDKDLLFSSFQPVLISVGETRPIDSTALQDDLDILFSYNFQFDGNYFLSQGENSHV